MNCPSCEHPSPSIDRETSLAHCEACGHIWEASAAPNRTRRRRWAMAPAGLHVEEHGDSTTVRIPWGNTYGGWEHLLWFAILLPMFAAPGPMAFAMSGFFFMVWVSAWKNVTTVHIDTAGVQVEHGPVPIPKVLYWSGSIPGRRLGDLLVETRDSSKSSWSEAITMYSLRADEIQLVQFLRDRDQVDFLQDQIELLVDRSDAPQRTSSEAIRTTAEGVLQRRLPDGTTVLTLPWNAYGTPLGIHLLWLMILPLILSGGVGALVGLVLAAFWLCMAFNSTTLHIRGDGVQVEHGPIPVPEYLVPAGHVSTSQLKTMDLREHVVRGRRWQYYYSLTNGPRFLLYYWGDASKLNFVHEVIQRGARTSTAASSATSLADRVRAAQQVR